MVSVQNFFDQCRHRTTIVFGNLGRWPDRVTYYKQDYPYTVIFESNFAVHIPQPLGKMVIVFTSHLDMTWDKGVELTFFQVGRPPFRQVWDAYTLDFTDCTRVADVYVKQLTWLDDWEMHRDDNVPWRMVVFMKTDPVGGCEGLKSGVIANYSRFRTIRRTVLKFGKQIPFTE
ncbi:uncharacterized protein TNCV_1936391 [Trichonephila clavipes]|nr:uncharacterized protein TNCV_1936391 [Trichonephila clavipes]